MRHSFQTVSGPLLGLLILAAAVPFAGCDAFEPPRFPVGDTVALFSLARAEYIGERSAFDFITPTSVVVERPRGPQEEQSDFDVAFSELDGQFVLLPGGLFESFTIEPGIVEAEPGVTFEAVVEAPSEGFVTDSAVVLREGAVLIIRTRQQGACARYAKAEILDLDPDGVLEFRFLRNNLCNDRTLTEADDD